MRASRDDVTHAGDLTVASALELRNVYRFFRAGGEETLALRGVSLTVNPGEMVAITGPSGSGKSTLLACAAGLDEPAGGWVSVGGTRISHRPEVERAQIRARQIGILLQVGNLLPHLDIRTNIRIAQLAVSHRPHRTADTLLDLVALSGRRFAYPSELSGGELVRAGLAAALANDPAILLADEPTGELDGENEQQILQLLHDQAHRGSGLLVVTHSLAVARIADRTIALDNGQVAA